MSSGRSTPFVPLALAAVLSLGCGARSGLDCFGERCESSSSDDDAAAFLPPDELATNELPPDGLEPRRPSGGGTPSREPNPPRPEPSRPPEQLPVDTPIDTTRERRCELGGTVVGSVAVRDRSTLLSLRGCEVITGDLVIDGVSGGDLTPLSSLRQVTGTLQISRYSGSLQGLESLDSVDNLMLEDIGASTLEPLQGLRQLGAFTRAGGQLVVSQAHNLRQLAGLSLAGVEQVTLSANHALESISSFSEVDELDSLSIFDHPRLTRVGFDSLQRADVIDLQSAALTSLNGLQSLREVTSLSFAYLSGLRELALPQLEAVGVLYLEDTGVTSLAGLTALRTLTQAVIQNNPNLLEIDRLGPLETLSELSAIGNPSLGHLPDFSELVTFRQLHVRGNAALATGPAFPRLTRAGTILITENSALAQVTGFAALQRARSIDISRNSSLVAVDFGALSDARSLHITCNPALDESSLTPLLGVDGTIDVWGNRGSPTPCP